MNEQQGSAGPRARPITDVFKRLGVGPTTGAKLIRPGPNGEPAELETFLIGRRRFATDAAIQRFLAAKIAEAQKETADDRRRKVSAATAASLEARAEQRAEPKQSTEV